MASCQLLLVVDLHKYLLVLGLQGCCLSVRMLLQEMWFIPTISHIPCHSAVMKLCISHDLIPLAKLNKA